MYRPFRRRPTSHRFRRPIRLHLRLPRTRRRHQHRQHRPHRPFRRPPRQPYRPLHQPFRHRPFRRSRRHRRRFPPLHFFLPCRSPPYRTRHRRWRRPDRLGHRHHSRHHRRSRPPCPCLLRLPRRFLHVERFRQKKCFHLSSRRIRRDCRLCRKRRLRPLPTHRHRRQGRFRARLPRTRGAPTRQQRALPKFGLSIGAPRQLRNTGRNPPASAFAAQHAASAFIRELRTRACAP